MARATTYEERIRIMDLNQLGCKDPQIAEQTGISLSTVRKWRRLGKHQDHEGLVSRMGRPKKGVLSTYSDKLREQLRYWIDTRKGWGAITMYAQLQALSWPEADLPSVQSINSFLKQESPRRNYKRHTTLPEPRELPITEPHQHWQMDARGHEYVEDIGVISLININDLCSHSRLLAFPCWLGDKRLTRRPNTEDYQLVLRLAFTDWGLPDRIGIDHDSVFYDNDNPSPFPTRFHLWLIALGIELAFGRKGFPTDQAVTERSHQLWYQQVIQGQTFPNWQSLYRALKERRYFLNHQLPCAPLGNIACAKAYPQIYKPRRPYRLEWEEEMLKVERIYEYLAKSRWFRLVSSVGEVNLGGKPYGVGKSWARNQIEITFDPEIKKLVFYNHHRKEKKVAELKGCTTQELMQELKPWWRLKNSQLSFPFTWNDQKHLVLYELF
jgi:transposase InsO family protein